MLEAIKSKLRMWQWWAVGGALLAVTALLNPAGVAVALWKYALVASAPVVGYWLDRTLFPYGRPDKLVDLGDDGKWETGEAIVFGAAMLRRALVMSALVYAVAVAI